MRTAGEVVKVDVVPAGARLAGESLVRQVHLHAPQPLTERVAAAAAAGAEGGGGVAHPSCACEQREEGEQQPPL